MSDLYITIKWKKRGLVSSVFNRGLDPKLMKPSCPLFIVKGAGSRRGREYYQKKKRKSNKRHSISSRCSNFVTLMVRPWQDARCWRATSDLYVHCYK